MPGTPALGLRTVAARGMVVVVVTVVVVVGGGGGPANCKDAPPGAVKCVDAVLSRIKSTNPAAS